MHHTRIATLSHQPTLHSFLSIPKSPTSRAFANVPAAIATSKMALKRSASTNGVTATAAAKKAKTVVVQELADEAPKTPLSKLHDAIEEASKLKHAAAGKDSVVVYWMRYLLPSSRLSSAHH